jgi:hypothetical protein
VRTPFFTHKVDPEWAKRSLDYEEMRALETLFEEWAFYELNIDADQRTFLIQLSSDYESLAYNCGPEWRAIEDLIDDPFVFIARQELRQQQRKVAWSAYVDRRTSYR